MVYVQPNERISKEHLICVQAKEVKRKLHDGVKPSECIEEGCITGVRASVGHHRKTNRSLWQQVECEQV
jgi:hypothetical protein